MVSSELASALLADIEDAVGNNARVIFSHEDIPYKSATVAIRFGAGRPRVQPLGDIMGEHATAPYKIHGNIMDYNAKIRITCKEPRTGGINDARATVSSLASTVKEAMRTSWPVTARSHSAFLSRKSGIRTKNVSFVLNSQRFLARDLDAVISVEETWDFVPDDATGEPAGEAELASDFDTFDGTSVHVTIN